MPSSPRRAGALIALIATLAVAAPDRAVADDDTATLALTGSAEIAVAPDRARIGSGVVTEGATAREALDANNAAMRRVIAALREAGVRDRDLRTGELNVAPRYSRPDRDDGDGAPRIVGYEVTNRLDVLVRDLDELGTILDRVVDVGANRVDGIAFEVSDADARRDEARARALRDARRKAEIYAEAGDFALERILSVSEAGGDQPRPTVARFDSAAAESVPVERGEQTLRVQVQVTWEIDE